MMNSSTLRWSLGAIQSSALNRPDAVSPRGTCPATLEGRSETSKLWIARMPDSAAIRRFHDASTPQASGVTRPRPVTTTRRMAGTAGPAPGRISLVGLDVGDRVLHGRDLLGGVVGNLAPELLLERHDELDRVEAVRAEIIDEAGVLGDLGVLDAEMLDDDLLHPRGDVALAHLRDLPSRLSLAICLLVAARRAAPRRKTGSDNTPVPACQRRPPAARAKTPVRSWPCRR